MNIYFDLSMGAAGDMLTAALLDLLEKKEEFIEEFNSIGIPGVTAQCLDGEKCGIHGSRFVVEALGEIEGESHHGREHVHEAGHHHDHHDDHHHHHPHRGMAEIESIISSLKISETVKENVFSVYSLLAEAESRVHGKAVTEIHFHEVGMLDAIADITAFCMLVEKLAPKKMIASPVCVGRGRVRCAHGLLPVPAPATALLLEGIPVYGSDFDGELCTPTGAALLRHFVSSFEKMPVLKSEKIGYGIGKKDFPAANCLRAFLTKEDESGSVLVLKASIDDMTGEELGFAVKKLLDSGALEAYTSPIYMKKSRPGVLMTVLCRPVDREKMLNLIFAHTTTIGIRESEKKRYTLERRSETLATPYGEVRVKISEGFGVKKEKIEYDDLARLAEENGKPLSEIRKAIEKIIHE